MYTYSKTSNAYPAAVIVVALVCVILVGMNEASAFWDNTPEEEDPKDILKRQIHQIEQYEAICLSLYSYDESFDIKCIPVEGNELLAKAYALTCIDEDKKDVGFGSYTYCELYTYTARDLN